MHAAPFNTILWHSSWTSISISPSSTPCKPKQEHTSPQVARQRFFLLLPKRRRRAISVCCVHKFVLGFKLACLHFYLLGSKFFACAHVCFSLSCMFEAQNESRICVLNADMFATPLTMFECPSYVAEFVHLLTQGMSFHHSCSCPFNKLILDFLEAE